MEKCNGTLSLQRSFLSFPSLSHEPLQNNRSTKARRCAQLRNGSPMVDRGVSMTMVASSTLLNILRQVSAAVRISSYGNIDVQC